MAQNASSFTVIDSSFREPIENFDLRNQVRKMAAADVLHDVIEKFVSDEINLSPIERRTSDGKLLPALTNLGMGYVDRKSVV